MRSINGNHSANGLHQKAKILIVDDHQLVRDGLRGLLESNPKYTICGEATSVAEAKRMIAIHSPNVVIADIQLPDESGLELIKWTTAYHPQTKTIVSTMYDESVYGQRALRHGASGFVCKGEASRTLADAIDQVLSGHFFFSEELTQKILMRATSRNSQLSESPVETLSDRELEILTLLGSGSTSEAIASQLFISRNTVGTYRERLKSKLNLKNCTELIHFAIRWVDESSRNAMKSTTSRS